ncbi:hypothetical protein [Sulfurisoma sediminicola]|nr:hypothetical protein [Sulfurisoma sediminicola]
MRKDYSKRCKGKWEASSFVGWNPRTELLKYLRNQDQHGEQVFITVHDRHFYDVPDDVEIGGIPGRQFVVDGHWQMTDQTLDRQPEGLEVGLGGPGVPYESTEILKPTRTESSYVLFPRKPEDQSRFQAAAVSDVHEFARDTLATLTEYFEFYKAKVGA